MSVPSPAATDPEFASPVEIDEELSHLYSRRTQIGMRLTALRRDLGEAENIAVGYRRSSTRKVGTVEEIRAGIAAAGLELDEIRVRTDELEFEFFRSGGWTRYYLVSDGHLHYDFSGERCSRVPTTTHYWMTEFSGQSGTEVIAEAGERVCTNCFPDAPVNPRPAAARFMTSVEAERAAYREQAARKRAAARAAQPTTPDGQPLHAVYVSYTDGSPLKEESQPVRTLVAARRQLMESASSLAIWFGPEHPEAPAWRENIERMIAAIAHATGSDIHAVRVETRDKITKKARKEGLRVLVEV